MGLGKSLRILFVFLIATSGANAAFDPSQVTVRSIRYSGSGCPADSVVSVIPPDASALSFLFRAFVVNVGGSAGGVSSTSGKCKIKVKLGIPKGWTVGIESADFRGFLHLDAGVIAQQNIHYMAGPIPVGINFAAKVWTGPVDENFHLTGVQPIRGLEWVNCFAAAKEIALEFNTEIRMRGGDASRVGLYQMDSIDSRLEQKYKLAWKECGRIPF